MKILFVCSGNTFRSLSAHLLLEKYVEDNNINDLIVSSAGTRMKSGLDPVVSETLKKYGVNAEKHTPHRITKKIVESYDLIISMAEEHKDYIKENFNKESVLFNKICHDEDSSVPDIKDVIKDYDKPENRQKIEEHVHKIIKYIHDSIPLLVKNLK